MDRHVQELGHDVGAGGVVDRDGFLWLPGAGSGGFFGGVVPEPVGSLVGAPSYVLLAPGGVGKSTVLDALREVEIGSEAVDLSLFGPEGVHARLSGLVSSQTLVYLDGLDRWVGKDPDALRVLGHYLSQAGAARVSWRLACRPAVWTKSVADELRRSLPGFRELILLPLSRAAAQGIGERVGVPDFVDVVVARRMGRLAASAMRYEAAARQWLDAGELPVSHLAAVRYEVRQMLTETRDGSVPVGLAVDQRLRVAQRLAAIAVFADGDRFGSSAVPAVPGRKYVGDLPSSSEPDAPDTPILPTDYGEVVGTALFAAAPDASVRFVHQQYAEYLAAQYVSDRGLTHAQVRELMAVRPSGRIPRVLTGVTAWIAAVAPDRFRDLIAPNVEALVQAGVELPSDDIRAAVVVSLLDQAASDEIDIHWGVDLAGLAYPGLVAEIGSRLDEGAASQAQMWWIAQLAEGGHCTGLAPALLTAALDPTWYPWVRRTAASAVARLGEESQVLELGALTHLSADEDADDELLASAIEALYPHLMTTTELLDVLRPRRNRKLVGAYLVVLGQLRYKIPEADLPDVLAWAAANAAGPGGSYGRLPMELIRAGCVASAQVADPAVASLVAAILDNGPNDLEDVFDSPNSGISDQCRREVAVLVADQVTEAGAYRMSHSTLLRRDDVVWMITHLPDMPPYAQSVLARWVSDHLVDPTAEEADLVLAMPDTHPAFHVTDRYRGSNNLDSDYAIHQRQIKQHQREEEELQATKSANRLSELVAAIDAIDTPVSDWWQVTCLLALEEPSRREWFDHDLTQRTFWPLLTVDQQDRLLTRGLDYVTAHTPRPVSEHPVNGYTVGQVMPDWAGVYLLCTLAEHHAERLHDLDPEVWRRWAPPIITTSRSHGQDHSELRNNLIQLVPDETLPALVDATIELIDVYQAGDRDVAPQYIHQRVIPHLGPHLTARFLTGAYSHQQADTLLTLLLEHQSDIADNIATQLRGQHHGDLTPLAYAVHASLHPNEMIDELVNGTHHEECVQRALLALDLDVLDDHHVTSLARLLLDTYPYQDDPDLMSDGYTPRSVRHVRNRALETLATRGLAEPLLELRQNRPETDTFVLNRHHQTALARDADTTFQPITPHHLLEQLGRSDARLVRNGDDLRRVVLDNLAQIQHEITHQGTFNNFWNLGTRPRPKTEDEITDAIGRRLNELMGRSAVADREFQVLRRAPSGIGTRADLVVTITSPLTPPIRVAIEAKLINHGELLTALQEQLVDRYLQPMAIHHGVYLVYWVRPDQDGDRTSNTDQDTLLATLTVQAKATDSSLSVTPFLLDLTRP